MGIPDDGDIDITIDNMMGAHFAKRVMADLGADNQRGVCRYLVLF